MAAAVQACVHCGFCLPTCPTYRTDGQEMDSPRGRITLMKEVLQGDLSLEQAKPHLDACLGCLSCETACPSGVQYRDLISPFRAWANAKSPKPRLQRLWHRLLLATLPFPNRFEFVARLGAPFKWLAPLLPNKLAAPLDLLPSSLPKTEVLDEKYSPTAPPRGRVALLAGCAQQILAPGINLAAIRLLKAVGYEVSLPPEQGCCGAMAWHLGEDSSAVKMARQNVDAFSAQSYDAIITTAAGCGSAMHEYPLILAGTDRHEQALALVGKMQDVCQFLAAKSDLTFNATAQPMNVTVQDACHLLHGQKVSRELRSLLHRIPGVTIVESAEADMCCGSAGTYNLDHPHRAALIGQEKARHLTNAGAQLVVTGNIGCLMQLRAHLRDRLPVLHIVEFLAQHLSDTHK